MTTFDNKIKQEISKIYSCNICDYNTSRYFNLQIHLLTAKHKNKLKTISYTTDNNENYKYSNYKYYCEKCEYKTCRKSNIKSHYLSAKHLNNLKTTLLSKNKQENIKKYECSNCNKNFNDRAGLWRHKKKCIEKEEIEKTEKIAEAESENLNIATIFMEIVKQNQEFQKLILEQNKQIIELSSKNNTNITNTNCHNKTFNLQVFLNEKCKDALNITDFVNSLNLSLTDLENVGENGFVDGISKIFVKGLKSLDIYKRPIHCSDLKRETMHVKEESGWEKDNENKDRLKKVVKMIAHKNMLKITDWKQKHPQYNNSDSKKNDQYLKILISSSGAYNKADEDTDYNKIIRNVAKEVTIDKDI